MEHYEKWKTKVRKSIDEDNEYWIRVGDWIYPSAIHKSCSPAVDHLCREGMELSAYIENLKLDHCVYCGDETPSGIKMAALMVKL